MGALDSILGLFGSTVKPADTPDDIRETVPWLHLTARAIEKKNKVFFLASEEGEYHLGACWIGSPLTGADGATVEKFRSALSFPLPKDSFVQFGLLSYPDTDWAITGYLEKKRFPENQVLQEYARRRAAFIQEGHQRPLVRRSGVMLNSQVMIVTLKCPIKGNPEHHEIEDFAETAKKFEEGLRAVGVRLESQDEVGYLQIMRRISHVYEQASPEYDENMPLREQVYAPGDTVAYGRREITFSDSHYCKLLSVKNYPKRTSLAIMNSLIGDPAGLVNQITDPFYLVLTLRYPDQVAKGEHVRKRSAFISHQVFGPTAHMIPVLRYKKEGFDTLVNEMDANGAMLCEMNLTLALFSKDKKKLAGLSSGLQTYFSALRMEMREDARILQPLWQAIQPLNTTVNGIKGLFRFRTMAIKHATQFLPVIGEWGGTGLSGSSIFVTPRGQLALMDFYASSTNYNSILFAEAGAGKSFATQGIIADSLCEGARVWTIDVGRSYKKLNAVVGGQFIEFTDESGICLNPFTQIKDIDDEMDLLKAMISKMAAPNDGLDDFRMSVIEEAVKSVWSRYGNNANINAVAEWCTTQADNRIQDIGRQLYPFTDFGSFGRWFNGENNLNFNNSFVVLELEELKLRPHLQKVVLLQLIAKVNREMYLTRGRKKLFVIDEAWDLLDDPVMAKAMESGFRRARKADGAVMVVTQSLEDFCKSPNGRAIFSNAAHQIIMKQSMESIDGAMRDGHFNIDDYGAWRLKQVHTVPGEYSEMMIRRDGDYGVVRYVTDRFTQILFSTKGSERDEILNAIDRNENVVEAIDSFIQREKELQA